MGNVSVKHKRSHFNRRSRFNRRSHFNRRHRGGLHSPLKDDASPRTIIRKKMRASVTRRRTEAKANSESPFGITPGKSRTIKKRNKTPPKETILEEAE